MKVFEPSVEFWHQGSNYKEHVARCARICYASEREDKVDELISRLINQRHNSVFRHATFYFKVPKNVGDVANAIIDIFNGKVGFDSYSYEDYTYIAANGNWTIDHSEETNLFLKYQISGDEIYNHPFRNVRELFRPTFKCVTNISVSRELNRVSPNNIVEQSTRYVLEDGSIVRPHWMTIDEANIINNNTIDSLISNDAITPKLFTYINSINAQFITYKNLMDLYGMLREDARGVLPLDTTTIVAYTYSIKEWRHILELRYHGITGRPHPNAKIIAGKIRAYLMDMNYDV